MKQIAIRDVHWCGLRFLDPACRAGYHDGKWYKAILPGAVATVRALMKRGVYDELANQALIAPLMKADLDIEGFPLVLEQHTEAYNVPPLHWSTLQLRDACLAYIKLNLALAEHGLGCIDGHAHNFIIQGADRPVWCDIGSFIPASDSTIAGIAEFIDAMVYPLVLRTKGTEWEPMMRQALSPGLFSRQLLEHLAGISMTVGGSRREMLRQLDDFIKGLEFPWADGVWGNYHTATRLQHVDTDGSPLQNFTTSPRDEMIRRFLGVLKPARVVDIGANAGFYSLMAADAGAEVLAVEPDDQAASRCHDFLRREGGGRRIKVRVDGVGDAPDKRADLVLALAVTHHMFFTHHYRLPVAARALAEHSDGALLTEFMPNGMGGTIPKPFPLPENYRLEYFTGELSRYFEKVDVIDYRMPEGSAKRIMVLCTGRLPREQTDALPPPLLDQSR